MKKIILLTVIMMILLTVGLSGCNEKRNDIISEAEVGIPLSEIGDIAKFYSYDADGIEVKYFSVKDSDGEVHAAFDACENCYRKKIGYRQDGEMMICISCPGEEYAINDIGSKNIAGNCWPSYLPIKINEGYLIIEKSDLEQNKWLFS